MDIFSVKTFIPKTLEIMKIDISLQFTLFYTHHLLDNAKCIWIHKHSISNHYTKKAIKLQYIVDLMIGGSYYI